MSSAQYTTAPAGRIVRSRRRRGRSAIIRRRLVNTSIMPDVIRANTNATIIMMAERIADWMKEGK
ncbi:MAG: hypothetical protein ACREOH_11875 [Candidatus Entotheonellia bacterium]